jgi:hypothetical protein
VMLRIPHCLHNRLTDGSKVVSPTHRPRNTPKKHYFSAFGTHFSLRLCKLQDLVRPELLGKLKQIIHHIGSRTHDLPACSIAPFTWFSNVPLLVAYDVKLHTYVKKIGNSITDCVDFEAITAVTTNGAILFGCDVVWFGRNVSASFRLLSWLTDRSWRWKQRVSPKRWCVK